MGERDRSVGERSEKIKQSSSTSTEQQENIEHYSRLMVRNKSLTNSSNANSKKPKKSESSDNSSENNDTTLNQTINNQSVHKQNLYIVSFPIILFFNILRSVLYQLFVIFRYIYNATTRIIYRPVKTTECSLETVNSDKILKDHHHTSQQSKLLLLAHNQTNGTAKTKPLPSAEMSSKGPGPGDPLLAKQKHHHRRAFEYISKALKIDEENEGK